MKCPNCGEPVITRHSFCVICGADLKDVLSESKLQHAAGSVRAVRKRFRTLTKPRAHRENEKTGAAAPEALQPEQTVSENPVLPGAYHRCT